MCVTLKKMPAQAEHNFDTFEKESVFEQKVDPKLPRSHFFPKRIHQKKFQLKIPIFSKSDDDATW